MNIREKFHYITKQIDFIFQVRSWCSNEYLKKTLFSMSELNRVLLNKNYANFKIRHCRIYFHYVRSNCSSPIPHLHPPIPRPQPQPPTPEGSGKMCVITKRGALEKRVIIVLLYCGVSQK